MASSILNELEAYLGVRLLERTTRALRLTEEGALYAEGARGILARIEALEDDVGASEKRPRGTLRVQIPPGLLRLVVAPELPGFLADYPEIRLELMARNVIPDFVRDRLDAAVFVGDLPDSSLVARTVGHIPLITLAAPDYLARRGTPEVPGDLAGHDTVGVMASATRRAAPWSFQNDGVSEQFVPSGPLIVEEVGAAVTAAAGGVGIVQLASYLAYGEVRRGQLVPVLEDWRPDAFEVRLVLPPGGQRPRKLRVFEGFLSSTEQKFRERWRIRDIR